MKLSGKKLKTHLAKRLQQQSRLPTRVHVLLDDLKPFLSEHKKVDVFDLLLELIAWADNDSAQYTMALLAITDEEGLSHLDRDTVANIAAFVRDTIKLREVLSN